MLILGCAAAAAAVAGMPRYGSLQGVADSGTERIAPAGFICPRFDNLAAISPRSVPARVAVLPHFWPGVTQPLPQPAAGLLSVCSAVHALLCSLALLPVSQHDCMAAFATTLPTQCSAISSSVIA